MATPSPDAPAFPQLEFSYWPSQIFWTVVALVTLYLLLNRVALPRLAATLEERQDTIANDLDQAAEFDRQAKEAEEAYEKALREARGEAQAIAERTRAEIAKQTEAALAVADEQIAAKTAESATRIAAIEAEAGARAKEVATETAQALLAKFSPTPVETAALEQALDTHLAGRFGG